MAPDRSRSQEAPETGKTRLMRARLEKLASIRERGIDPYPARFKRTATTREATERLLRLEKRRGEEVGARTRPVSVAGRIMARRDMGRAAFVDLQDGEGRIQVHMRSDVLGTSYDLLEDVDLGDFLGVRGPVFRTRRGEVSVEAREVRILAKAVRPLPDKWSGLQDVEKRYRQRYLDLITNEDAAKTARARAAVVASMRRFLNARGFMEVETPVLVPVAAGAMARPFVTRHNALDRTLYLRIATELPLKKLIIGGIEKVYEIGRIFRNEGIDLDHNPEFTMLESYEAYADYNDVMEMVEAMTAAIAEEVTGSTAVKAAGGAEIDLAPPWPRLDLREELVRRAGIDFLEFRDAASLTQAMRGLDVHVEPNASWGRLLDKIISSVIEPHLIQPAFLVDYPVEMSPLAKRKPGADGIVERFEAFAAGSELANAFTELNDPVDQRARFEEQERLRREHDEDEVDRLDEDFLVAVEHGMPPAGGLGMGVDRLATLLVGKASIREVILFPQLRTL